MSTMLSKLRRPTRVVALAVAATALVVGAGSGTAAVADQALPVSPITISDTGWDFRK
ncbi:MAG: hypothetical protein Q8Q02_02975 [Nocardioides sp.]|nr:hypothetical protein [Nocardioides sp.]